MNNLFWLVILAGIAGSCVYYIKKRNKLDMPVQVEIYDSVTLTDIVSMLKLEHPDQKRHTPFIGTTEFLKTFKISLKVQPAPDQTPIVFGIYDSQAEKITYAKVLFVKSLDEEVKSVLKKAEESEESFVILG